MARRGREGMAKRAREHARKERQEAKRERRRAATNDGADPADSTDEDRLLEEFRLLSEGHAAGRIGPARFEEERTRILTELGIDVK